jgi:hypothetical protein
VVGLLAVAWFVPLPFRSDHLALVKFASRVDRDSETVTETFDIENQSAHDELVDHASASSPGVVLVSTTIARPLEVRAHRVVRVIAVYRVRDCSESSPNPLPITLHVNHWWGSKASTIADRAFDYPIAWDACGHAPTN